MTNVQITKLNLKTGDVLTEAKFKLIDDNTQALKDAIEAIQVPSDGVGADGQDGADGREIELRKASDAIEWRYVEADQEEEAGWNTLITLAELKGDKGEDAILPKLDSIEELEPSTPLEDVVTAFNLLVADLKAKGYMA